jgi:YbgC/YbaW family acyl-CoA thioester hydrolase
MSLPVRQDFRLIHRLRVRWAEVDLQRIVFNPHYLMYIDTAFTEYWRELAIPYEAIPQTMGGDLFVKKATVEYHGSARLEDLLDIGLKCQRIGNSSMVFQGAIFRGEDLLITVEMVYVFADPASQTSRPVPPLLRDLFTAYEAGLPTCEVRVGAWSELGHAASGLRRSVFMEEFRIAADMHQDAADTHAVHALVFNRMGTPLATARLTCEGPGVAGLSRVAVTPLMRSTGIGRTTVQALLQLAHERGDTRVVLRSPCSAEGFYSRLGFLAVGEPLEEAGISHIDMARVPGQR